MPWSADDIPDQSGRTAVITGGNGGLGLETARELARAGAHVVIAARNLDKAAVAEQDIRSVVPGASLEIRKLDLASLGSIHRFADEVLESHASIDLLFNNAGVMATPEWRTADGFEMQFGTNHLGHFALTARLFPALLRAGRARVVNTTSTARFFAGTYDLSNPHNRGTYDPWVAYGYSKRANLQFALELNRRLAAAESPVTAHAADPGFSNTDLQAASTRNSDGGWSQRFFHVAVGWFGQSPARGALTLLRAASDPAATGGSLFRPKWVAAGPPVLGGIRPNLRKPADLAALWDLSEAETGVTLDVAAEVERAGR